MLLMMIYDFFLLLIQYSIVSQCILYCGIYQTFVKFLKKLKSKCECRQAHLLVLHLTSIVQKLLDGQTCSMIANLMLVTALLCQVPPMPQPLSILCSFACCLAPAIETWIILKHLLSR